MYRVAILVSGGGTDLQSIIDGVESGYINCSICAVISDNSKAYGIERAKKAGIKTYVFDKHEYGARLSDAIYETLCGKADLIVLAGFLSILGGKLISEFKNKIINIHPSLIPAFCGKGMYGMKVHEKAIEFGVKVSGCTVHFVDDGTDSGPIIMQRTVEVNGCDTPKDLQERILVEEHKALPEAVKLLSEGRVEVCGRKVIIH